jgi:hypothetical protein
LGRAEIDLEDLPPDTTVENSYPLLAQEEAKAAYEKHLEEKEEKIKMEEAERTERERQEEETRKKEEVSYVNKYDFVARTTFSS